MAIQTVTADNLAGYVAERTTKGSDIATGEQLVAAAEKATPKTASVVVATGEEKTPDAPPEPQGSVADRAETATKKEGKKDVQERINELTRLRKEAEEFAEDEYNNRLRAERRIAELENQLTQAKPVEPPKAEALKEPDPKDFADIAAFTKAWTDYNSKVTEQKIAQAREEERQRVAWERQNEEMRKRVERAKADIPDFVDVIESADRVKLNVPPHVQALIVESDYGPEIAYHLAKNPDEQARIFAMTPAKALAALGRIEARYEKQESAEKKADSKPTPTIETTRAPAPVASIRGDAETASYDMSKPMPFEEYRRLRKEQMRRKRH